eukprot:TRINITY_DN24302_c0_g1_i1.p1 TRINITY_DN24302_c0_g1~~TRINITY_DN24302_c0_g1_i1.p1  ORF type:complete len:366 (+),score=140.32 TRINITY_DN24302_c0_g1_i1:80-1099(+)
MRATLALISLAAGASGAVAPLRIDGLVAATFTPFRANGSVATEVVPQQAAWLQKTGVKWVFVSGTTGESVKLSSAERRAQAEEWVRVGPKYDISVIIHCGTDSLVEAAEHAAHAQRIGAQAVGWMPPVFFKPATVQALAQSLAAVAAAAPNLPFYYYHIPSMTGVVFPMLDMVKAIDAIGVPNFAGVKYTGLYTFPGFMDASRVAAYQGGKYEVLSGREDMMLEAVAAGIKGFVGSQFNFAGDLFNQVRQVSTANITAGRTMQLLADDLIGRWQAVAPTGVNANKNLLNVVKGVPVGDARLPAVPIDTDTERKLLATIQEWCADSVAASTQLCKAARAA